MLEVIKRAMDREVAGVSGDKLSFFQRVRRLSSIDRCSNTSHIKKYPVSDHSFYMALYAMVFADLENQKISVNLDKYNVAEVIKKALIHDLEESVTGDILFPLHNSNQGFKEKLDDIRLECVEGEVFCELPKFVRSYYIRLWRESKDKSKEGQLVACMDKFEILLYAVGELDIGNTSMRGIYDNAIRIIEKEFVIPSVMEVVEEIKAKYSNRR